MFECPICEKVCVHSNAVKLSMLDGRPVKSQESQQFRLVARDVWICWPCAKLIVDVVRTVERVERE